MVARVYLLVMAVCLALVILAYFRNNPMHHSERFLWRRFVNWFPLGMTYSFLYLGRYNLNVAKTALGALMSNSEFGLIFGIGTGVYAVSFLVNGPFVDRIGGKKGIMIAAVGAASANIALGICTYFVVARHAHVRIVPVFAALYALNMYFQSYGAVSIIKVKAYWFHVRERGVFGAIFGTLISFGVYFAFDWGQGIVNVSHGATWMVFFVPAAVLIFWALIDIPLVVDTPKQAGFEDFDTHDASSGQMHVTLSAGQLLKKVFTSPLMLCVAAVELTSGVFRNGATQWYPIYAREVRLNGSAFFEAHWGWLLCLLGIIGGFAGGFVSDKLFHSRRAPPAAIFCGIVLLLAVIMSFSVFSNPWVMGMGSALVVMCAVGVTSLMSGTAATDFGGRKATATASGIIDGFAYMGSSIQSVSLGYLTKQSWNYWPVFLIPFAIIGLAVALRIWWALPPATKNYLAAVEKVDLKEAGAAKPAFST